MGWKKVSKINGLIDTPIPTVECIIALKTRGERNFFLCKNSLRKINVIIRHKKKPNNTHGLIINY